MRRFRNLFSFFAVPVLAAIIFAAAPEPVCSGASSGGVGAPSGGKEPLSCVLMRQAANDPARSQTLLEQAQKYSPDFPPVYFKLAAASLRDLPGGIVSWFYYVIEGAESYGRNWWWAIDLSGLAGFSLIASFFTALFATVCLRMPREFPLLKHDMGEQRGNFLLLLVPAVSAFFGPGLFLASLLLLLGLYFQRRDRVLVYLVIFFFAAVPFLSGWVKSVCLVSNPQMRAIVSANSGADDTLALKTLADSRDFEGLFSYGLALRRSGRLMDAINAYTRALEEKKDPRAYVNLANCYMLLGDTGKAGELYTDSLAVRPTASAYFDFAQLSRNNLDYEKGGELYRKAVALDPARVSSFMNQGQSAPNMLMDDTLGMGDFFSLFETRRRQSASAGVFGGSPLWVVLFLWLAVFFRNGGRGRVRAFRCSRCGRILCDRCEREPYWGRMCRDCYQSLVKLEVQDPKKRVARLLKIHGGQLKRGALIRALAFAPPGIAYIYGGYILQGMLMLWAFLFFATAAALNPLFATGMQARGHGWLGALSIFFCGLLYIFSFIGIRRRQGRQWL